MPVLGNPKTKSPPIMSVPGSLSLQEAPDFSLVLGGPLYQLFRRAHIGGQALELVRRRVLFFIALTWLPLLILSAIKGNLLGGQGLPFLRDIETHVRFLIGIPVLLVAELVVHQRIRPVVKLFLERGIVITEETPKFYAAIEGAMRTRNSIPLELGLLAFAFTVGHWAWAKEVAMGATTWYAALDGAHLHLTLPGYWYGYFSVPIAQFILLRWYMRLVVWFWLLWRVSRLRLRLIPTHPDRAGGIGFLGGSAYAFAPLLFAQGAMLAGIIASRILYQGQNLMSFKVTIVALVVFLVLVILGPLTVFSPQLASARRRGLHEYGTLATNYVANFDEKWLRGGARDETILGTGDIQSLADLSNSCAVVGEMRIVPFALRDVTVLAVATVAPLLPLLLTVMPLDELLIRLAKVIF